MDTESRNKALAFVRSQQFGVLSTSDKDGQPWGAAIFFLVDDDFNFYFLTRTGTQKFGDIDQNPQVALTVVDRQSQVTVQLAGTVSKVDLNEYAHDLLPKFANLKPDDDEHWHPPVDKIHSGNYVPLKITPTRLQYADYGQKTEDITADHIVKIIGG
ncbi:pyridoxamine 5'-phosphate oxidase family protein [Candidatus Saccharibacteria bacterium]|nr:pyridoxamine 5'-phosphate oxidase family protein [Candidatus Saccharibacteria bacterium]